MVKLFCKLINEANGEIPTGISYLAAGQTQARRQDHDLSSNSYSYLIVCNSRLKEI